MKPRTGSRTGSLRRRLAAVVAGSVAGTGLLVAALTGFVVTSQLHGALDTSLSREATRVQRLLQTNASYTGDATSECRYVVEPACARTITTDDDAVGSGAGPLVLTQLGRQVVAGTRASALYTHDAVRVVVVPLGPDRAVMVGLPTRQTDVAISRTWFALSGAGGLAIVLAAVLGYAVAAVGLRPVRALDAAVRRVRDTADPHARVDVHRNDELGRLAEAFDDMLAELAAASDAQRDFVADASHELRTPLTTLRTNLQLLGGDRPLDDDTRDALRRAVTEELREMQATIDDLAELARGDQRDARALVTQDLAPVLADAAAAAARHWQVPFHLGLGDATTPAHAPTRAHAPMPAHAPVTVPEGRLGRLLAVVLDNAGKYGAGQPVTITVGAGPRTTVVTVTDRGIGIPEHDRDRVFDRFHRADTARGVDGSGLGLAIAAQVVDAAGGSIRTAPGPDGTGTTVRIALRTAPAD